MKLIKYKKKNSGQAIIEALVALGILSVAFFAVLSLLDNSISLGNVVSDQNIATYLAGEGIEIVKNLVDTNISRRNSTSSPASFDEDFSIGAYEVSYFDPLDADDPIGSNTQDGKNPGKRIGDVGVRSTNPLDFDEVSGGYYQTYPAPVNPSHFYRTIVITRSPGKWIKAESIVQWIGKGGVTKEIKLEDYFYNWRIY
ncbi:MAG: hypothetical protein WCX12_00185 [Candidatus Paceibacterota bacterium]|jgi:hypothetical protein